jgi:hypothetical protein
MVLESRLLDTKISGLQVLAMSANMAMDIGQCSEVDRKSHRNEV